MRKSEQVIIEEYEITPFTLVVKPIQYGSKIYTEVMELEDNFISPFRPIDVIKKSCEFFGSSYDGRKEGTKRIIGITHKAPIAIAPMNSLFFFPTTSPLRTQCTWLSFDHIIGHGQIDSSHTFVTFRNKQTIEIEISFGSFENQLLRTAHLKTKLLQRITDTERKSSYLYPENRNSEASEGSPGYPLIKR